MKPSAVGAAIAGFLALVATATPVAAHPGHGHRGVAVPVLPAGLFLLGVAVLGGSLYADHRHLIGRRTADAGVVLGIWAGLTGITLFWL